MDSNLRCWSLLRGHESENPMEILGHGFVFYQRKLLEHGPWKKIPIVQNELIFQIAAPYYWIVMGSLLATISFNGHQHDSAPPIGVCITWTSASLGRWHAGTAKNTSYILRTFLNYFMLGLRFATSLSTAFYLLVLAYLYLLVSGWVASLKLTAHPWK